ncbi:O-antigen ligase family protein [Nostoc sp. CHAB 5836]|nr:O-antigen ligase family protein [Nostoc sp. CHAB 5836]
MIRFELLTLFSYIFYRYRFTRDFVVNTFVDIIGVIMILSLLAAFTNLGVMSGYDAGRWRGVFGHKNSLGEYSGLLMIVIFSLWKLGYKMKIRHALYAIATTLCLLKAGSATAIGVFALSISVFTATIFFARVHFVPSLRLASFLTLLVALVAAAILLIPIGAEMLGRDLTFTGRTEIWNWFLFFGNQRPWSGWGWATIGANDAMLNYIRETLKLPQIQTPHNGYISIIVEIGYPALVAYILWLLWAFVDASYKAIVERDYFHAMRAAIITGLMVHNFFESTAGATPSLWLLLIISTGKMKNSYAKKQMNDRNGLESPSLTHVRQ